MKIIKHSHENAGLDVTGCLVGLHKGRVLEVTNCFPDPSVDKVSEDQVDQRVDNEKYRKVMMKMLSENNVDNNRVGWYKSRHVAAVCTRDFVNTQYALQKKFGKSVVGLVYNTEESLRGNVSLRAYRLTDTFMKVMSEGFNITQERMHDNQLDSNAILEEVPVKITNTPYNKALMYELSKSQKATETSSEMLSDHLDLSISDVLESELSNLVACVGDLAEEQSKFQRHERDVTRQKQLRSSWLQERRLLNAQRVEEGMEPLPEYEANNNVFKKIAEPSRLNSLLIGKQIRSYCDRVDHFSGSSFSKQFLAGSLHK